MNWSTNVLGDPEKRIKKVKKDLEECRRRGVNESQVAREELLRYKLERLEDQVDTYWRQTTWLQKGDRNTSFFHAACAERRQSNRIGKMRTEDGGWVEGENEELYS